MKTVIQLSVGTMSTAEDMAGWIITSPTAVVDGAEDIHLKIGDRIDVDGDVIRSGAIIANVA